MALSAVRVDEFRGCRTFARVVEQGEGNLPVRLWGLADDAKELLTKIGYETSLRYAIHLITAAALIAMRRKVSDVDIEDVSRAYTLFLDVKRSEQYLAEFHEQYLYNEVDQPNGVAVMES
eukprot:jgi/Botrbrau1/5435/Bobra.182_1s0037.1